MRGQRRLNGPGIRSLHLPWLTETAQANLLHRLLNFVAGEVNPVGLRLPVELQPLQHQQGFRTRVWPQMEVGGQCEVAGHQRLFGRGDMQEIFNPAPIHGHFERDIVAFGAGAGIHRALHQAMRVQVGVPQHRLHLLQSDIAVGAVDHRAEVGVELHARPGIGALQAEIRALTATGNGDAVQKPVKLPGGLKMPADATD